MKQRFLAWMLLAALLMGVSGARMEPAPEMYINAGEARPLFHTPDAGAAPVRTLYAGEAFEMAGEEGGWARVRVITEAGQPFALWARPENLRPLMPEDGPRFAMILGGDGPVRLRARASRNADSLGWYFPGVWVRVLGQPQDGWAAVAVGSLNGFLPEAELLLDPPSGSEGPAVPESAVAYADGPSLTLRAAQSYQSDRAGAYPNGTMVTVLGYTDDFAHVLAPDGKVGFMMGSGISPQGPSLASPVVNPGTPPPNAYVVRVDNPGGQGAHLRARASTGSESLGLYANGSAVYVIRWGEFWTQVWADGRTGYMMTKLLGMNP
ncbi:MAG TPA: SH3 domain-containing protein [Candidatus Limnocylindria bacterium]|nr:SH3 domain-containing protein [Candidatus Limnocylindria bacterium]